MKVGCKSKPLGEVVTFLNGLWKGEKPPYVNVGVIRNTNFTKNGSIDHSDIAWLDVEARQFEKRRLKFGDIILERSGGGPKQPVGRVALFEEENGEYSFSNFTSAIRINDAAQLSFRFLHKFLFWKYASGATETMQSHSTGIRNLNMAAYKAIEVPLPPLPAQERIVEILEKVFAGLEIAVVNGERNRKNAEALFESRLAQLFGRVSAKSSGRRLGDIVSRLTNGYVGPIRNVYVEKGIPYLLARHVRNNRLAFDGKTFISTQFNEKNRKSKLRSGDVLLVQSGHIGHSAVVGTDHEGHNCHAMIVMTPIEHFLLGDFLSFYFSSPSMKRKFDEIRSGSTVPHLTCRLVKELIIPVPNTEDQRRLVSELKELREECDRLATIAEGKLRSLNDLKNSIMQEAFSGALTSLPSQAVKEAAE